MAIKTIKSIRLQLKHGTEDEWLNSDYVPLKGEAIIYDIDSSHDYERLKIGDGIRNVNKLPFHGVQSASSTIDNGVLRVKDVPKNSASYARVNVIGGRTMRINVGTEETPEYVLRSAPVTRINGAPIINSWKEVQRVVREGKARDYFEVGDQLVCNKGDTQMVWDIIGFDHDVPASSQYKHSMTLQLHDCFSTVQFDEMEALFYCEKELPAGTYNVTLPAGSYGVGISGGKTYQFTITQSVPAGGVVVFPWHLYQTISTYSSRSSNSIESVFVTAGNGGIALESMGECNHRFAVNGSNNWKNSAIRQFLNSSGSPGTFWVPQTQFDMAPEWNTIFNGFLRNMDEDFLEVIGDVIKRTTLNTVCDGGGYEDTVERFFLISSSEAAARSDGNFEEGAPYEYYSTANLKNKNFSGSPYYWTLRSCNPSSSDNISIMSPDDIYSSNGTARHSYGVAPACNII